MRLCFLSFYSGLNDRGVETFVHELATKLSAENEVTVFRSTKANAPYKIVIIPSRHDQRIPKEYEDFRHQLFFEKHKWIELGFYILAIPKIISGHYDAVIPLNSGLNIPILKFISLLFGFKLVISAQSGPGWDDRWNLFWHPDLFVTLSKTQANWARRVSPNQNIETIPNGVDLERFSEKGSGTKHGLKKPVILAVGATINSKRLEATIAATAKLKNVSLLIVGNGPLNNSIDSLGKKLLGNRYLRKSFSHHDMPKVYRSADIFTLVSDSSEAFGIAYLEALASGLPIVVTDDSSRREIVGDNGIFIENPKNTSLYAKALQKALNQRKYTPHQWLSRYSWTSISKKWLEALEALNLE